jgi:hypothetical protein
MFQALASVALADDGHAEPAIAVGTGFGTLPLAGASSGAVGTIGFGAAAGRLDLTGQGTGSVADEALVGSAVGEIGLGGTALGTAAPAAGPGRAARPHESRNFARLVSGEK